MARQQLCVFLVLAFRAVNALATLPIPELHFEDKILEDEETKITCTLTYINCIEVSLAITGNATFEHCVQKTDNQSNTVSKTCTVEVTKDMDKMEFICEAHFKTQSKPKKMYIQTEPVITDCPDKLIWKEGEDNSFHCKATGYPAPTVTCEKDRVKYTEGQKYKALRNMTGAYTCTAKNFDVISKLVEVSVQYKPEVLHINVNPPLRNEGDQVTITCQAEGEPAPAYSWKTPSSDVQFSPDNTTITIQSMQTGHLGAYRCTATNKHGSHSLEEALSLEVKPKILDMKVEPSSEVFEGYNITLSCKASGTPTPTFNWYHPKADVVLSSDRQTIKIWNIKKEHMGTYSCTATNKHGNVTQSQEITLAVKPKVLSINVNPSTAVSANENLTLTCVAQGEPAPTYSWDLPTPNVFYSQDKSTINILAARNENSGDYKCTAQNKHGQNSMTKRITVTEKGNRGDRLEMSIATILTVLIFTSLMFSLF